MRCAVVIYGHDVFFVDFFYDNIRNDVFCLSLGRELSAGFRLQHADHIADQLDFSSGDPHFPRDDSQSVFCQILEMVTYHQFKDLRQLPLLSQLYQQAFCQICRTHTKRVKCLDHRKHCQNFFFRHSNSLSHLLCRRSKITILVQGFNDIFSYTCLLIGDPAALQLKQQMLRQRHIRGNIAFKRIVPVLIRSVFTLPIADIIVLSFSNIFLPVKFLLSGI